MKTVKIGEHEFTVAPLSDEQHNIFVGLIKQTAKKMDSPVARFIDEKLKGVTGEDRSAAIQGFMRSPGWDDPPKEVMNKVLIAKWSVRYLAKLAIIPAQHPDLLNELITDDNAEKVYFDLCKAMQPLTNDEIIENNKKLREAIQKKGG